MLKQSSSGMRKILAVLLVGLFVVSLTAMATSAHGGCGYGGWDGYPWWGYGYPYRAYPAATGLPYMMGQYPATSIQASTPVASTQAPA